MGDELVSQVLQSPALRNAILSCIREVEVPRTTNNSPISSPQQPAGGVRDELRRLFPTLRQNSSQITSFISKRKRKEGAKNVNYLLDIILVNPEVKRTLLGRRKAEAYETGFAVSSVEFTKIFTATEVRNQLRQVFHSKLDNREFEILVPIGGYLAKPSLNENQQLDGLIFFKIFNKKIVYLRPLKNEHFEQDMPSNSLNEIEHSEFHSVSLNNNSEANLCDLTGGELECDLNLDSTEINESEWESTCINDILLKLRQKVLEDKCTIFNIFREDIYKGYLRAVRRKSFSPYNKVSVCFTDCDNNSEGAGDAGGPKRELFRLLLKYIKDSRIFKGPENEKYIVLNRDALEKEEYLEAGRIIVLSIIHCGLCPYFFSEFLFNLITSDCVEPKLDHIMDNDIKQEIESAVNCQNEASLRTVIIEGTYFRLAGWDNIISFEKKENIIKDVIKFYAIEHITTCVNQLIEGLKTFNFYEKMQKYPEYFVEIMCSSNVNILNVRSFEALFQIQYSEEGSNKRRIENKIIAYWKDYLIDCYENEPTGEDFTCSLEEILTFCTGSDTVPLFGFSSPISLQFLHNDQSQFPKGNTCGLVLHLPTVHNEYEAFKLKMSYGIKNGMVFGFW